MAGQILLINPIGVSTRKPRKLAKVKTVKKRKSHTRKRRANPIKRARARIVKRKNPVVRRRRRNPIETVQANPMTKRRRRRHTRRNPISLAGVRRRSKRAFAGVRSRGGAIGSVVMPAMTAAAGGILLDLLWANLPIPAKAKVGNLQYLAKGVGAVGMVMLAKKSKVVTAKTAEALGIGAMTIVMHDAARNMLKTSMPGLHLGEYVGAGDALQYRDALSYYDVGYDGENLVQNYALPPRQKMMAPAAAPMAAAPASAPVHGYDDYGNYVGDYGDFDYDGSMGEYVGEYVGEAGYI